jgi:hypothetical protein
LNFGNANLLKGAKHDRQECKNKKKIVLPKNKMTKKYEIILFNVTVGQRDN